MVRLRAWDGAQWRDVQVWTGAQWKAYSPAQFGAGFYREDFNAPGIPAGWTGGGGLDGTQFPVANWANVHLYVDTVSAWLYPPSARMKNAGPWTYQVKGGQTVHFQAGLVKHLVAGVNMPGAGSYMQLYATFNGVLKTLKVDFPASNANTDWAAYQTDGFVVPGTVDTVQTLTVTDLEIMHLHTSDGMTDPTGQYRVYMDWCRIIDSAGNELLRQTVPAVEPLKVWNGTAWV